MTETLAGLDAAAQQLARMAGELAADGALGGAAGVGAKVAPGVAGRADEVFAGGVKWIRDTLNGPTGLDPVVVTPEGVVARGVPQGKAEAEDMSILSKNAEGIERAQKINDRIGVEPKGQVALNPPQGFDEASFQKFAKSARQLSREAGLPQGELVVQGSRVTGTARASAAYKSDIDIALRVDEKTFFDFAQARISSVRPGTKLHKALLNCISRDLMQPSAPQH